MPNKFDQQEWTTTEYSAKFLFYADKGCMWIHQLLDDKSGTCLYI